MAPDPQWVTLDEPFIIQHSTALPHTPTDEFPFCKYLTQVAQNNSQLSLYYGTQEVSYLHRQRKMGAELLGAAGRQRRDLMENSYLLMACTDKLITLSNSCNNLHALTTYIIRCYVGI